MTALRAILVDLDGTLVETAGANYDAYARSLAEVGISISREDFEARAGGRNWRQFLPELLDEAGITADPARIAQRKASLYAASFDRLVPNEALIRLLRLRSPDCRIALVTSASAANVRAVVLHLGLVDLFDTVITGDDVARHKPAPDAYQLAARRLGVQPAECIVIEDSDAGAESARVFGAPVLRVSPPAATGTRAGGA